jgi:hypothetical protein
LKQVTARPADLRLIPSCCYAFCWLAICTASAASASWWKNCACIWHGAGSRVWVPIRRFRITPRSRRTVIGGFRNRNCSRILSHAGIFQSLRGLIHRATSALAVLVLSSKSYSCIWEWSVIEFQSAQLESLRVRVNQFTRRHHIELTTPGGNSHFFPVFAPQLGQGQLESLRFVRSLLAFLSSQIRSSSSVNSLYRWLIKGHEATRAVGCMRNRNRSLADSAGIVLTKANLTADEHLGHDGKVTSFRSLMSRIGCLRWATR